MFYDWIKDCYKENQLQLRMMNCLNEDQFRNLVTKKYKQKSKIELQQKIINQSITKNARYSYYYASDVLHGPFPLGEPAIATEAYWSYKYARYILHRKPFLLGEPIIATNLCWSYEYALNILQGPFPLGEQAIAKDAQASSEYAGRILHGPFPEGEPAIATNPYWKEKYEKRFKVKL